MNVSGKSQISPPEVAASGVRTDRPISAPIQEKAYPSRSSRPKPAEHLAATFVVDAPADEQRDDRQDDQGQRRSARGRRAYGR